MASACTFACNPSFQDCDSNLANGCEPLNPYFRDQDGDTYGAEGSQPVGDHLRANARVRALQLLELEVRRNVSDRPLIVSSRRLMRSRRRRRSP